STTLRCAHGEQLCARWVGFVPYSCSSRMDITRTLRSLLLWAIILSRLARGVSDLVAAQPCSSEKIFARSVADECGPSSRLTPTLDWTAVIGEIFEARNAVFWEGPTAAREQLISLLALVAQSFELASQCPSAVATAGYSLAEVIASTAKSSANNDKSRQLKQLSLIQFALAMLPTRAHRECTQWPLRGRDLAAAFQQLGEVLFPTHPSQPPQLPASQEPAVAVVTACAGIHASGARARSKANRQRYAAKHGYDLHFFNDAHEIVAAFPAGTNLTRTNAPAYWRAYALLSVIGSSSPNSWLLWVDCEVFLTDLDMPVTKLLAKHGVTSASAASMLVSSSSLGVGPEVLLLQTNDWGRSFLRNWTTLPSPDFLHPVLRIPSDERHAERVALQHAVLPHWGEWLQGHSATDWDSYQWPPDIRIALGQARFSAQDRSAKQWELADFAWTDDGCRGRDGLRNHALCSDRLL
ncbi:unnamed protein product, partial [Symbiodinium microadriaticum]